MTARRALVTAHRSFVQHPAMRPGHARYSSRVRRWIDDRRPASFCAKSRNTRLRQTASRKRFCDVRARTLAKISVTTASIARTPYAVALPARNLRARHRLGSRRLPSAVQRAAPASTRRRPDCAARHLFRPRREPEGRGPPRPSAEPHASVASKRLPHCRSRIAFVAFFLRNDNEALPSRRQRILHQLDPVRRAVDDRLVVEIIGGVMQRRRCRHCRRR